MSFRIGTGLPNTPLVIWPIKFNIQQNKTKLSWPKFVFGLCQDNFNTFWLISLVTKIFISDGTITKSFCLGVFKRKRKNAEGEKVGLQ